jgi:hypothetical protein
MLIFKKHRYLKLHKNRTIMKLFICLFSSIICLLIPSGECPAESMSQPGHTHGNTGEHESIRPESGFQASAGYWNDNFVVQKLLGAPVKQGKDDFETASFWLQVALEKPGTWWFLDVYYNVLTNKEGNYRTDLLTLRLSLEKESSRGGLYCGTGVIASGNFGGGTLQNAYHRCIDSDRVRLPYPEKDRAGLIGFMRFKPIFWSSDHVSVKGYVSNSYKGSVGPSNIRAGMEFELLTYHVKKSCILHLQTQAGYFNYYLQGKYLSPLFKKGFLWGLLLSGGKPGNYNVAVWFTSNQYGLEQPHFGITLSFRWNGSRMSDLCDIEYP